MPSRRFLVLALLLVLAAVAAGFYLGRSVEEPLVDAADLPPPGRWRRSVVAQPADRSAEERARLLSLPYSGGTQPAPNRAGVTHHDPALASPGANLLVSGHGPEALLLDMSGRVLHRWRYRFEDAFPRRSPTNETLYFRRAHLLPNGDLLVLFQGGGLVRLDRDSRLLWSHDAAFYNDLFVDAEGTIYGITKEARVVPRLDPGREVLEDSVVVLSAAGEPRRRISLLACFLDSPFAGLLDPLPDTADIFHTNTIEVLDGRFAARSEIFRAGNILVSLREIDTIAIVDPERRTVVWARRGPWVGQHQPTVVGDGKILLFDNRGAGGLARILELDPLTGEIGWYYRGPEQRPLTSPEAGSAARLPNGNTLITESEQGRAIEVTRDGSIVWEFVSPHRAGPLRELVATLFEVVRLPPDSPFLASDQLDRRPESGLLR